MKQCKNIGCKAQNPNNAIKCKVCNTPFFEQKLNDGKKHIRKFTR